MVFLHAGLVQAAPAPPSPPHPAPLTLGGAVLLGLVEGVTEYLPVSSTGHLLLVEQWLGLRGPGQAKEAADAYAIAIQAGAIAAVLGLYRRRLRQLLAGLVGRDPVGRRLGWLILLAFAPAAVLGLALGSTIKAWLFGMWPIVAAWFLGGLLLLGLTAYRQRANRRQGQELHELGAQQALLIGLAQCVAMWPGTSRSLATIVGGLLVGLGMPAAVEFSFLLGLVTLSAATAHDILHHGATMLRVFGWQNPLVGALVAALSAACAIRWMVRYLERRSLALFGWYRIGLAALVALLLFTGLLNTTA